MTQYVFIASDGAHGYELWVTDGTKAGTSLVKDINPGSDGSYPQSFVSLGNGEVIFGANDGTGSFGHGFELWVTDGTKSGTSLVKDINPAQGSFNTYSPGIGFTFDIKFVSLGDGKAVFEAFEPTHGVELWVTDGTKAGTMLVKDLSPGSYDSYPYGSFPSGFLSLGNGKAVFQAIDATHGTELWVTDGTKAGTSLVKDINPKLTDSASPGPDSSYPSNFVSLGNGKAVFTADDGTHSNEVWVTDGTRAGTVLLKDIYPGQYTSLPHDFLSLGNGKVVFDASDGTHGTELWVTDGTKVGTKLLKDINPGSSSDPSNFVLLGNGEAIFTAEDGTQGDGLWVTDGTAAGTKFLGGGSSPSSFTSLGNGKAVFSANDSTNGTELWVTDGTAAGTVLVKDINPGGFDGFSGYIPDNSSPENFMSLGNGKAVFSADDETHGRELWVTDGTTAGTMLVKDISSGIDGSSPSDFVSLGMGQAVFSVDDETDGSELWVTDGTVAGTTRLKNIDAGNFDYDPGFIVAGLPPGSNTGTAGRDILRGTTGANTLRGLAGNDDYYVNNAGDHVYEAVGMGNDRVFASISYTLAAKQEIETLQTDPASGKTGLKLTGNEFANIIKGDAGANRIDGGGGSDRLYGLGGNDMLTGGGGADTFVFVKGDTGKTHSTADTIDDFTKADTIDLTGWDADSNAKGIQHFDFIGARTFEGHAGELHFVRGKSDTWIEGDTNGDKHADFVIHLDDAVTMKDGYFDL